MAATPQPSRASESFRLDGKNMKGRTDNLYLADPDLIAAANVALACNMPLLLTGEPGCGKTDFAYAVASEIAAREHRSRDEVLFDCPIRSDSRARDLLYVYDAVGRFSDAQLRGREGVEVQEDHPRHYIRLEALGRAFKEPKRTVVLVDEIDKAPRDLPNDLLRPLEDSWFDIPELLAYDKHPLPDSELKSRMKRPDGLPNPLVIVTSNQEQQLPEPFLRRCVFHHISFPAPERLGDIIRAHFGDAPFLRSGEDVGGGPSIGSAVVQIAGELRDQRTSLRKKPGTAELLRWTTALLEVFPRPDVEQRLAAFLTARGANKVLPWRDLPALGCLVKLREDMERLGVLPSENLSRR